MFHVPHVSTAQCSHISKISFKIRPYCMFPNFHFLFVLFWFCLTLRVENKGVASISCASAETLFDQPVLLILTVIVKISTAADRKKMIHSFIIVLSKLLVGGWGQ